MKKKKFKRVKKISLNEDFYFMYMESIFALGLPTVHLRKVYVEKEASDQGLNTTFLNQLIK